MKLPKVGAVGQTCDVLEVELTADELVAALLGLEPSRRLHLLDSCGARGDDARFLIAGFDPAEVVEAYGDELHFQERGAAARVERGSVLSLLDERLSERRSPHAPSTDVPACGACFVTLSYELVRQIEKLRVGRNLSASRRHEPDAALAFFDTLVIHDYARGETKVVGERARLREAADVLLHAASDTGPSKLVEEARPSTKEPSQPVVVNYEDFTAPLSLPGGVTSNFTRDEYMAAVGRIREHIFAGDIYQANLTQQLSCAPAAGTTPERVFLRLRREHPASFAAFVRLGEGAVVSASPERFLRVRGGRDGSGRVVEAWPIKGTRPRGATAAEDARLRAELLASEKDAAENVMIVDLMRNDLGRVCRHGTVEVAELCALQEHPTLFHLVSKVRGRLREGVAAGGLLRAAFPCGSITGAPKIRAMEILDGVETVPRGFSMGSIGYFSFDGAADLNVAIRTITFGRDRRVRFNVGGGVVADSDPASEYDETLVKARALLRALRAT